MTRLIVDVREPEEFSKSHVEGAINIPPAGLLDGAKALANIPKDTEIILYCLTGSRSNVSKNILENLGYTRVVNGINKDRVTAKYLP